MSAVQDFIDRTFVPSARDLVEVTKIDEGLFVLEAHDPVNTQRVLRVDIINENFPEA
jgi:hypothetical protein